MRNLSIIGLMALTIIACGDKSGHSSKGSEKSYSSKAEAEANSSVGISCEKTTQVPISRGRGKGLEGKYETVTVFYPGYLRADINNDGKVTEEDAKLAVKKFFKPENFDCPRTADVAGYPQTYTPDSYFTSQDIYVFHEFLKTGVITWPQDVICGYDCDIVNHMQP